MMKDYTVLTYSKYGRIIEIRRTKNIDKVEKWKQEFKEFLVRMYGKIEIEMVNEGESETICVAGDFVWHDADFDCRESLTVVESEVEER